MNDDDEEGELYLPKNVAYVLREAKLAFWGAFHDFDFKGKPGTEVEYLQFNTRDAWELFASMWTAEIFKVIGRRVRKPDETH